MKLISYEPLFKTLEKRGKTIIDLNRDLNLSPATTAKFKKGESVTLDTLKKICTYLDCRIEEVVEFIDE